MLYQFKFVDVRKNYLEKNISESILNGNVKRGMNIIGICKFKKCKAFNQKVTIPFIGKEILNMKEEFKSILCPYCVKIVAPLSVAFNHCKYLIKGSVINEEGYLKNFQISGRSHNCVYFSPDKCGKAMFLELTIIVNNIFGPLFENNSNIYKYYSY